MDETPKANQEASFNINLDTTPILYTENVNMNASEDGIVLNFCQRVGPTNQLRIVSRIGMSRSHAKKFMEELARLVVMSEGQIATGPKNSN